MAIKGKTATLKDVRYALEFGGERLLRTYSQDDRLRGGRPFHPEQNWNHRCGARRVIDPVGPSRDPRRGRAFPGPLPAIRVEG